MEDEKIRMGEKMSYFVINEPANRDLVVITSSIHVLSGLPLCCELNSAVIGIRNIFSLSK